MTKHKIKNSTRKKNIKIHLILLLLIAFLVNPKQSSGQIRAGSGYLKMLHGAREVGMAGTVTGVLNYTYSFYGNPGATGFLRERQWSATYTNWISDLYNASFIYGRKICLPWSRWTKFALGMNYLGIPEFNNANDQSTPVSGNNLLVTASIGQPFSLLSGNLSLGANIKYFRSELAQFKANAMIFDIGLLYRTPRFVFLKPTRGFLDYIIFSSGLSVTNLGNPISFISDETPLPRTFRGGIALNIGSHHGFQMSLATDYRIVRDEDGFLTFGSEFSWRHLVSLRLGYSWENNLLGHVTFGGSLRLDDQIIRNIIPGRNNALRLDLAANRNNDYFDSPYHGSITYQPIGPEKFRLISPIYGEMVNSDSVSLKWESTTDPDLYDDVDHWLLVDRDSAKFAQVVKLVEENQDSLFLFLNHAQFLVNQQVYQSHLLLDKLIAGDYFWTVLAYDMDRHVQFAEMKHQAISKFHVTKSELRIVGIDFDYNPWITQDEYQGVLRFTIRNFGDRAARNFSLLIYDSLAAQSNSLKKSLSSVAIAKKYISHKPIPTVEPELAITINLEWRTAHPGLHHIRAEIVQANQKDEIISTYSASFYTIPKGIFTANKKVIAQKQYYINYYLPYVGKVFFDKGSAEIKKKYIKEWDIESPLALFARRMRSNPSVKVLLRGTIDPNSGEYDISLANQRANAVRDTLYNLGVSLKEMKVLAGTALPVRKLPKTYNDTRWVLEERRRVDIVTNDQPTEKTLFSPLETTYINKINLPVTFNADIAGVVPLQEGAILLEEGFLKDTLNIKHAISSPRIVKHIDWPLSQEDEKAWDNWLENRVTYSLVLTDTLNRRFEVRPQNIYLKTQIIGHERRYYVLAKYETTEAFYNFYWTSLLDAIPFLLEDANTRMRFIGHSCATGSNAINEALSKNRAHDFQKKFLQDVKKRYPDLYEQIKQRLDPPKGYGESRPFEIKSYKGKKILVGDNNKPLGRQLNRRVMVFFYTSQ